MKITRNNNINFFFLLSLVLIYKFTLDYIYVNVISTNYSYIGYKLDFNRERYIISLIIIILSVIPLKKLFKRFERPSAIIMIVFYLVYFYPNLTLNSLADLGDNFFYFSLIYWWLLTFCYFSLSRFNLFRINVFHSFPTRYFYILSFSVLILAISFIIYYNGFKIKFTLNDIYEIRADIKEMDLLGIVGYIKPLASKFTIILLMYFLIKKKRKLSITMIIIGLMLFAFGAHKTDFFFLIITLLIYFFYSSRFKLFPLYGLIFINIATLFFIFYAHKEIFLQIISIFHIRTLFTPNLISSYYFDFFSSNELLLLREHINPWIGLKTPYDVPTRYLIGKVYRNAPNMSANTGLIGTDFANFGWASLIIFPILRILFLLFLDRVSFGLDSRILLLTSFSFAFMFINGTILGTLLTGGFLMVCFLLYLIPRKNHDNGFSISV